MSDLHEGEKPVEPILAQTFEGNVVTVMEGVLPMVTLTMPEGYPVGTHLRFAVEVRVANVRFEEGRGRRKGDFARKHVLMTEGVELMAAFIPSELDTAVVGTAAGMPADLEEEAEQIEELPLDPIFEGADPDPRGDIVESLDQQISRMAEEQAAEFAAADEEQRLRIAAGHGLTLDEMIKQFSTTWGGGNITTNASSQAGLQSYITKDTPF